MGCSSRKGVADAVLLPSAPPLGPEVGAARRKRRRRSSREGLS